MSTSKRTAQEFIQGVFSPMIAVLCSSDAEELCRKNNLSFVELIQPFCTCVEVTIRDPTAIQGMTTKVQLCFQDLNIPTPQTAVAKKLLNDAVTNTQTFQLDGYTSTSISVGCYNFLVSTATPWFDSYRDVFFQVMPPLEHDFTRHYLACVFVVSSSHAAPQEELQRLIQAQQQYQLNGSHHSRWFFPQVFRYHVLLHDVATGNLTKAEAVYQSMKNLYGSTSCHLLQINSVSPNNLNDQTDSPLPDIWSQFLVQNPTNVVVNNDISSKLQGSDSSIEDDVFKQVNQEATDNDNNLKNNCTVNHPLLSSGDSSSPTLDTPVGNLMGTSYDDHSWRRPGCQFGHNLLASDRERVHVFIQEFCQQGLLPYIERQLRFLNDQVANKKGFHRSLVNVTKKFLSGNKIGPQGPNASANSVIYSQDAPELQVRKLGDLAFLFHLYELAYQAYHSAKRDFYSDQAWLYLAGAQEMAALAVFMLGSNSQRPFPVHYMNDAIVTYLNTCKLPQLATRATLLSVECMKNLGHHSNAAVHLIRMTSEDSDLRSALLLEQAAYCFLIGSPPLVRKYAFHIVLAGHRYSKAGQRKLSLRAYKEALQVYKGRNWSLAEDHINFTIGRQSVYLKQTKCAFEAFHCLLAKQSEQSAAQQILFLREYILVLKQLFDDNSEDHPALPLPSINVQSTKVYLGPVANEVTDISMWLKLEEYAAIASQGSLPANYHTQMSCLTNDTDNSTRPLSVVGECITVEMELHNPMLIPLSLTSVYLLWSFIPSDGGEIVNNSKTGLNRSAHSDIIEAQFIDEIVLEPEQKSKVQISVTPKHTGDLHITGVVYSLGLYPSSIAPETLVDVGPLPSPVVGQQMLGVHGPKLKNIKIQKSSQVYAADLRLQPTIVPAMPQLKVRFSHLPSLLFCGEVQKASIHLSNIGKRPLKSLFVASPTPEVFSFGLNDPDDDSWGAATYREEPLQSSGNLGAIMAKCPKLNFVCSLPEFSVIEPGENATLPFWIRGPDVSGTHVLRLLFYYENPESESELRHRVLCNSIPFSTLPSLSLQATARPSISTGSRSTPDGVLISLLSKNCSEVEGSTCIDLSLLQVTCVSKVWSLSSLTSHFKFGTTTIKPQETKNLALKVVPFSSKYTLGQDDVAVVSQLPLARIQVESTATPCLDFCWRASLNLPPLLEDTPSSGALAAEDNLSSSPIDLTIAIIWKAAVERNEQIQVVMGQQHVNIYNFHVTFSSVPGVKQIDSRVYVPIYPNLEPAVPSFQFVKCTLVHPAKVKHDFVSSRLLVIPVAMKIHNPSLRLVTVSVEQLENQSAPSLQTSPVGTPDLAPSDVGGFTWVTGIQHHQQIKPRDTITVSLMAAFSSSGTYNLACLDVSVITDDGRLFHEVLCPSLLVVQQQLLQ